MTGLVKANKVKLLRQNQSGGDRKKKQDGSESEDDEDYDEEEDEFAETKSISSSILRPDPTPSKKDEFCLDSH